MISKEGKIVTDPVGHQRKQKKFCAIAEVSSSLKVGFGFVCIALLAVVHSWNWAEKSIIWVSDTSNYQPSQAFLQIAKVFANFWQRMKKKKL